MNHPFDALRKLRWPGLVVKVFWLLLVLSPFHVTAENHEVKPTPYGPFIIEQALLWLPDYIGRALPAERSFAFRAAALEIRRQAYSYRYAVNSKQLLINRLGLVQYREGGDPVFNLEPGQPARTAVTGNEIDSPVIFNLGRISDPEHFTFADALALWVHEIGHKVKQTMPDLTQTEIDAMADKIGLWYGNRATLTDNGARKIWTLSPSIGMSSAYVGDWRIPLGFGVIENGQFYDLTTDLNLALDQNASHGPEWYAYGNFFERERTLLNLQPLQNGQLLAEIRTDRLPLNDSMYFATDLGGPYYRSGLIEVTRDLKIIVESYVSAEPPGELISDAEAELADLHLENGVVTGKIYFHLHNQTHFHAVGYPDYRVGLVGLLDGRPLKLEAKIRFRMSEGVGLMPAEAYKRSFTTEASFEVAVDHLKGDVLEFTGAQSRFFTYGVSWQENEQKRLRLRASKTVPLSCAGRLQGR